jgi:hypothetical protein
MRSRLRHAASAACAILIVVACSTPSGSSGSAAPVTTPIPIPGSATPVAVPTSEATAAAGPPTAVLAAEGGDPVDGQLGSYIWGDGGSDGPWLHGAPVTVGAREPLTVTLRPDQPIASWTARYVVATADGPDGATPLGQGQGGGQPRFAAPSSGSWTVEVHVVFADAAGNASYFWQLTAR